jgi:hypothetical protein
VNDAARAWYNPGMSNLSLELDPKRVVETRSIILPQGGTLEVQMTQEYIDKLRQHFGLFGDQPLDDDHVRMYVWGSLNSAVDKAETKHVKPHKR